MIDFILRPIRRNFGKDKMFYRAIDDMFGFVPHNIELYKLALIHKSASIVLDDGQHINNERLEFLGDAIIESVSSDYLFIEFPDKNEGFLTQLRSKMVSRQTLNSVAKRIGLDDYVITNAATGSSQKHIYGDAFEAMMGAIYLDQGYEFVNRLLINKIFAQYLKMETLAESETDFKSRLIEWCQKNHHTIYFATSHDKTYSATHPFFYSKVLIDNIEVGHGAGESKKEAEQRAAFSVSQGFNDDECTKILDRLDNLDPHQNNKQEQKPIEKAPTKRENKSRPEKAKVESKPTGENLDKKIDTSEKSKEKSADSGEKAEKNTEKRESNPEDIKPKPTRTPRKVKAKATTTVTEPKEETPTKESASTSRRRSPKKSTPTNNDNPPKEATPNSEDISNQSENQPEAKPKPRRRRSTKDKAQTSTITQE